MAEITYAPSGPTLKAWLEDDTSFVKLLVGPLGSAKTTAACIEILRRAGAQAPGPDGIRRSRWACIRNTFAELKTTTVKSWAQWAPTDLGKFTIGGSPIVHKIVTSDMDLEVLFIPLDKDEDVKKLLSMELTGAWIDECREVPKSVLDTLTGRVGRYPSKLQGGCTWSGVLGTSNPSDTECWLYKVFHPATPFETVPEGWKLYRQPSGRSPQAENLENLPAHYYERMLAGKDPEWIKVFVDGEFGFVLEGQVVYPSFRDSVHVSPVPLTPMPHLPLTLGADWGLTPACVIGQQLPDGRVHILGEYVCEDSGIVRFATGLSAYLKANYPECKVGSCLGDPAGTSRQADERTIFDLMNEYTPWRWRPAPTNEVTLRIEAVSAALNRLVDGHPGFLLDPRCGMLRKGFAGGYCFQRVLASGGNTFHEAPKKNQYSHPHDALQYLVLGVGGAEAVLNRDKRRNKVQRVANDLDYPILSE